MNSKHFDIAHYAGHKAIEELHKCYRLYTLPIGQVLRENNIQISSFDFKSKSDINELVAKVSLQEVDIDKIDNINAFHLSKYLTSIRKKEIEFCINTAIFFQVMMESDINDVLGSDKGTFEKKWKRFLKDNNATNEETNSYQLYFKNIYIKVRTPSVHPKQNVGIRNIYQFKFEYIYKFIKEGWFSFCFLLNKTRNLELNYEQNWKQLCKMHNLPATINESYKDIEELSMKLNNKYLEEFNN